jgi:CheY-like chemotaxis protein
LIYSDPDPASVAAIRTAHHAYENGRRRAGGLNASVLIVEDDRDTREMLGRFLELEGFEVRMAANGQLALQTLHEDIHPCVIILDLMMPVMNGWQFREIQRTDPELSEIPVVVVTAAGPRDDIPSINADGWLSKPVDFDRLLETIGPLCEKH